MLDFWKSVIGLCMMSFGIFVFIWVTRKRLRGDEGGFGSHVKLYVGSIGLFIIGLTMLVRELMKLQ